MGSAPELGAFHASLDRALSDTAFIDRFYDSFIASSGEIELLFRHADMPRLKRKLKNSLRLITQAIDDEPGAAEYLELLGRTHKRLGIEPRHFDGWIWALIDTVAQCDAEFGPDTERVWRTVLSASVVRMQAGTIVQAGTTGPAADSTA